MNMELRKATTRTGQVILALAVVASVAPSAWAVLPQPGDLVMAHSDFDEPEALELVNGPVSLNGGVSLGNPWTTAIVADSPIQAVKFDNLGGIAHNANGNLIGADFGGAANGGIIYSLSTTGADPPPAAQALFSMNPANPIGPVLPDGNPTRISGLSVSPDNTKIAINGYDSRRVIVFDYTAGDGLGTGTPALTAVRHTTPILTITDTQGTAWLDNNTVLAFATGADLYTVNATTMATNLVKDLPLAVRGGEFTSIVYNPAVSPYIYAGISSFAATVTENTLFILDPADSYNLVKQLNLSTTLGNTLRDMAIDADGNLFISMFGGDVSFIVDVVTNPTALTDDSPVAWFSSAVPSGFNGIDIGFGEAEVPVLIGDYNGNDKVDIGDYNLYRNNLGTGFDLVNEDPAVTPGEVTSEDYDVWKDRFGDVLAGSGGLVGGAVPEPASVMLLMLGAMGLGVIRRGSRG